jgi:nucleotide-binding universal stress UspA family protein
MSFRKILVAHDFSEPATRALRCAANLATQMDASLDIAYVLPDIFEGPGDPSLAVPNAQPGETDRYLHFLEKELAQRTHEALGGTTLALGFHVLRGDPAKQLESLAAELGADALCIGATGKGAVSRVLLGSVALRLLRSAALPILLVP